MYQIKDDLSLCTAEAYELRESITGKTKSIEGVSAFTAVSSLCHSLDFGTTTLGKQRVSEIRSKLNCISSI